MIYVGIDPGLSGAVAVIEPDSVQLFDSPTWEIKSTKRVRGKTIEVIHHEYDVNGMNQLLMAVTLRVPSKEIMAGLEKVHSMPDQGVASGFKFGMGYGIWQGILSALGIAYQTIPPQRWKKTMMDGMGKEKDASMIVAQKLFPTADIRLRKHHGRADALLLAEYMRRI
jgi:hypothetical protein